MFLHTTIIFQKVIIFNVVAFDTWATSRPVPAGMFLARPNMSTVRLPFGLQLVPKLFSAVTEPIAWVLHCHRVCYLLYYLDVFQFLGSLFTDEPAATLLRVSHVPTVGDTCGLKQNQNSSDLCDLPWYPHWHKCLWTEASHRHVDLTASTTE